jgi:hypothetical protein
MDWENRWGGLDEMMEVVSLGDDGLIVDRRGWPIKEGESR